MRNRTTLKRFVLTFEGSKRLSGKYEFFSIHSVKAKESKEKKQELEMCAVRKVTVTKTHNNKIRGVLVLSFIFSFIICISLVHIS